MADRIDPWSSKALDYGRLLKGLGIEPFHPRLKEPHLLMRRGMVFGQTDFGKISEAAEKGKDFAMLTGLMPSGKFHLGHKMLAEQMVYYQGLGAKVFVCVADVEAYNVRRTPLDELRAVAVEEYLLNYIALGLKPKNCDFYFQSSRSPDPEKANAYHRLVSLCPRKTTMNEMGDIYGELTPGKVMAVMHQVADILHPQLPEFGGKMPVVVPVGADQSPHLRFSRDIASRFSGEFDFLLPASTYHRFLPGLKGGKMSSSDPLSYIALSDSPETAGEKVMKHAFSGGRNSVEEHRKLGGVPEVDVAYQMLAYGLEPDDRKLAKLHDDYLSGRMLTGELKAYLIERLQAFLKAHQKKRELARKQVSRFLKV